MKKSLPGRIKRSKIRRIIQSSLILLSIMSTSIYIYIYLNIKKKTIAIVDSYNDSIFQVFSCPTKTRTILNEFRTSPGIRLMNIYLCHNLHILFIFIYDLVNDGNFIQ